MSNRFDPTGMKVTQRGLYNPIVWVLGIIATVFVVMILATFWDRGRHQFSDSLMDHRATQSESADSVNSEGGSEAH